MTPLICCSIGVVTVSATVWASAPVYVVVTWTCGGTICGYSEIGRTKMQMPPISSMSRASTVAKIGRPMKKLTMAVLAPVAEDWPR